MFRAIPWWLVAIGIPIVVVVAVGAVWLLLAIGVDRNQLDAIRTGGTLGVGLGGSVVLWLAVRRQRTTELDLLQKYETHRLAERVAVHNEVHQQRVAEDAREDSVERRITELYTRAVEQLGSDKAPVRLGGLYALERLAQNDKRQRQTIVNVLCAYLRMPYSPPPEPSDDVASSQIDDSDEKRMQEREVRLTAQRILAVHLRPDSDTKGSIEKFWGAVDLDLTGADLVDLDFRECHMRLATFAGARFHGTAWFTGARFTDKAVFYKAHFGCGVQFGGAEFEKVALLHRATFAEDGNFAGVKFRGDAVFAATEFVGKAQFDGAQFAEGSTLPTEITESYMVFETPQADFKETQFRKDASFRNVQFGGGANFCEASFGDWTSFEGAKFTTSRKVGPASIELVRFSGATFSRPAPSQVAQFISTPNRTDCWP